MKTFLLAAAAAAAIAAPAGAVVVVDFTSNAWSGADGNVSHTVGDVTLTRVSASGNLTFNSSASERAGCELSDPVATPDLACDGDGIGIIDDEITQNTDVLRISFGGMTVDLFDVHLLDLFQREGNPPTDEGAEYSLDNSTWFTLAISNGSPGGYREASAAGFAGLSGITEIYLRGFNNPVSDFSLARILYEEVPEPGALGLLGLGVLGMGFAARRRRPA